MVKSTALTAVALAWATSAVAQGVPTIDGGLVVRNEAANAHRERDLATQRETLTVQELISEIEEEQLAALESILDAQTSFEGAGVSGMVSGLEEGGDPEASAELVYNSEDSNPAAPQLFGDAALNVEELIIQVAQSTHGLGGVGTAGLSVVQWRCLLQALIWQESRFSIGARSPVGAFGLTQIMPGTAGDLGIYPDYYDSPYLQVDGGARYLSRMLAMFDGNIIHALAAYNAGPGNVQDHGGVPPFQETQHYVQVIPAKYNAYLSRIGGVDALGTIDHALLANSNLSFTGTGANHYANGSMVAVHAAAQRVRSIVHRIGDTEDVQEAMALNTYARAELGRLVAAVTRLQATHLQPQSSKALATASARQREQEFMDFTMEEFD